MAKIKFYYLVLSLMIISGSLLLVHASHKHRSKRKASDPLIVEAKKTSNGLEIGINDKEDISRNRDNLIKSDEQLSIILSEALSKSRIVQENSDVFIQLGKYLTAGNSSKSAGGGNEIHHQFVKQPIKHVAAAANTKTKGTPAPTKEIQETTKKKVIQMPGYAAWPYLYTTPRNSTISRIMNPPGYMKMEGKDFSLPEAMVTKLRMIVKAMDRVHTPQNRSTWETMNFYRDDSKLSARRKWHNRITRHDLYPPDEPELVDAIMDNLAHGKITSVEDTGDAGTQIKFIVWLEDGSRAMVKPIRFSREQETLPDHYYFADHERHVAEIASFHLDRLLNFRRVPPVTGRLLNMTSEIFDVGEDLIKEELFVSPAGNICYRGGCDYYCNMAHLTCGRPDMIEVSMMAFLPSRTRVKRTSWEHPWRKSYSSKRFADWEDNNNYCVEVKQRPIFQEGRRMLDLMDTCIFDFLIGNTDRHHFNTFQNWDNFTFSVHVDNGKGFGNSKEDEMILLLPVAQCCTIRFTTLRTLFQFHNAPMSLGQAMKRSLEPDILEPVLLDSHLDALDRRVKLILQAIGNCLTRFKATEVIIDDGF